MRVVVVVPAVTGNGAMRFHLDLAPEMEKLGVEYELFSVGLGVDEFPVEDPGIRLSVGFPQGVRRRYGLPVMLGRLARAIRDTGRPILHRNRAAKSAPLARPVTTA
jgi:hypothetical protein